MADFETHRCTGVVLTLVRNQLKLRHSNKTAEIVIDWEGEAPAEPGFPAKKRLGGSLGLPQTRFYESA